MKRLDNTDRAGLYLTIIFHLAIIIILLTAQIGYSLAKKESFVIDFSKLEEAEKVERQRAFDEAIEDRLDEMIAGTSGIEFKNVAVNRNSKLKDDRNTDAEQLYKDAERLAKELKSPGSTNSDDEFVEVPQKDKPKAETKEKHFSGPSVVSYSLDGRKASTLPIPAYRCYGGGMVTVIITVNNQGTVVNAKVQDEVSSDDKCLRDFAVRAARMSKFSISTTAPSKQVGDIVYQFIAQ